MLTAQTAREPPPAYTRKRCRVCCSALLRGDLWRLFYSVDGEDDLLPVARKEFRRKRQRLRLAFRSLDFARVHLTPAA